MHLEWYENLGHSETHVSKQHNQIGLRGIKKVRLPHAIPLSASCQRVGHAIQQPLLAA